MASPPLDCRSRIERAWAYWTNLGRPKLIVAPMVDNSELPFRMLCRNYGAQAAYTPMLDSHLFAHDQNYRAQEFTTCKEDRPLMVQFCGNDPDTLLKAAKMVEPLCDYVDINLGCPLRSAKDENYRAFLMDNLPLIKSLVEKLALNLNIPVSCKIRLFPELEVTLNYAKMLEQAGCSLLAAEPESRKIYIYNVRANWKAIKAVKQAVRIPVLANRNIRHMDDVELSLKETGADGFLSADSLLENPALFAGFQTTEWAVGSVRDGNLEQVDLLVEYLELCKKFPVPWRMIRDHDVSRMLGEWFKMYPRLREDLDAQKLIAI